MTAALIRGIALNENPRTTAARMLRRVEGDFTSDLTTALLIAPTETLDAQRAASHASHLGQPRHPRRLGRVRPLDTRTCPSCLARHGQTPCGRGKPV